MKRVFLLIFVLQAFLTGSAVCMGIWCGMPWLGVAGLALLGVSLMAAQSASLAKRHHLSRASLGGAWLVAFITPVGLVIAWEPTHTLDSYYAILAWVMAAAVLPASNVVAEASLKSRCRILGMVWVLFGNSVWIAYSYTTNQSVAFHLGMVFMVAWLIALKLWFRLPPMGVQIANTLVLVCVGLPIADFFLRPKYEFDTRPQTGIKYYSFERAKQNPTAFANWWRYYVSQWDHMGKTVFMKDPEGALPFRLKPGTQADFFESPIRVNSLGFRGKEVPFEKGNAYRIVTIGESTTFGCTLKETDKTWPALLEKLINERLDTSRPVQVINAGVPSYTLSHNLHRLATDVLPLEPDMLVSYHGYNGLRMINQDLPARFGSRPPLYQPRPLKLLGDCEYRLKLTRWKEAQLSGLERNKPSIDPMKTSYADAFRSLIKICRTNDIRLVLATFSMAVNQESEAEKVEFYRAIFPSVHWEIEANAVLTKIVKNFARKDQDICLVDTQPFLDGKNEFYTDIVHFTQPGRERMAELFFAGMKDTLEEELAVSSDSL